MLRFLSILGIVAAFATTGCAKKDEDKDKQVKVGASAKLQFANNTALRVRAEGLDTDPTYYPPSLYEVKFLGVGIQSHADVSSQGYGSAIYVNPDCKLEELETSAEDYNPDVKKEDRIYYKYIGFNDCTADDVDTFIDLAAGTESVNTALNAQNLPILPGTFKFATLSFCIGGATSPNVRFQTEGMTEPAGAILGTCGVTSAEMDPPLEVKPDESVVVSLAYDLSRTVYDYGEGMGKSEYCYFNDDSTVRRCVNFPDLTVTVTNAAGLTQESHLKAVGPLDKKESPRLNQ